MTVNHEEVLGKIEQSIRWFRSVRLGTKSDPLLATRLADGRVMLGEQGKCWAFVVGDLSDLSQLELECYQAAGYELPVHSHPAHEEITIEEGELIVEFVNGGKQIAEVAASEGSTIVVEAWHSHSAVALHDCKYTLVYSRPAGSKGPAVWLRIDGVLTGG